MTRQQDRSRWGVIRLLIERWLLRKACHAANFFYRRPPRSVNCELQQSYPEFFMGLKSTEWWRIERPAEAIDQRQLGPEPPRILHEKVGERRDSGVAEVGLWHMRIADSELKIHQRQLQDVRKCEEQRRQWYSVAWRLIGMEKRNTIFERSKGVIKSDGKALALKTRNARGGELLQNKFDQLLFVYNFSSVSGQNYRVGVPLDCYWKEILNRDAALYGAGNQVNFGGSLAAPLPILWPAFLLEYDTSSSGIVTFQPESHNLV